MLGPQQHTEELATIESLDNGKPYDVAKSVDVPMVSTLTFMFYQGFCVPIEVRYERTLYLYAIRNQSCDGRW